MQGEVLGITRFGLAKMKESVLMLASVSCMHTLAIAAYVTTLELRGCIETSDFVPFLSGWDVV